MKEINETKTNNTAVQSETQDNITYGITGIASGLDVEIEDNTLYAFASVYVNGVRKDLSYEKEIVPGDYGIHWSVALDPYTGEFLENHVSFPANCITLFDMLYVINTGKIRVDEYYKNLFYKKEWIGTGGTELGLVKNGGNVTISSDGTMNYNENVVYAEGEWTPVFTEAAVEGLMSNKNFRYTRIGNVVHCYGYCTLDGDAVSEGLVTFNELIPLVFKDIPFTINTVDRIGYHSGAFCAADVLPLWGAQGGNRIGIYPEAGKLIMSSADKKKFLDNDTFSMDFTYILSE